jgi:CheY-like chemotaxis protein
MVESDTSSLQGRRLLVVEDDYFVAADLVRSLSELGVEVIGPASSLQEALLLVTEMGGQLDGAVLDVNLREERVFPAADALRALGVPVLFTTGYDTAALPVEYSQIPRCEKPVDKNQLFRWLSDVSAPALRS